MRGPIELSKLDRFYVYGVTIGGLVPVLIFYLGDRVFDLLPPALRTCYEVSGVLFLITVFGCAVLPKIFPTLSRGLALKFCAMTSLLYLNAFVFATGGPMTSMFAYHYLYIPVVVGYSLGTRALRQAAFGCVFAYIIVLIVAALYGRANDQYLIELSAMNSHGAYMTIYVLTFLLQLLITYLMARSVLPADAEEEILLDENGDPRPVPGPAD